MVFVITEKGGFTALFLFSSADFSCINKTNIFSKIMKIYESLRDYFNAIPSLFDRKVLPYDCLVTVDRTTVAIGLDGDADTEYCKRNGIDYCHINYSGGTIVMAKDCIGLCRLSKIEYGFRDDLIWREFIKFLNSRGIENVEYKDNDLLIDGYKVASDGNNIVGSYCKTIYMTYQFSINQDMEVIEKVCRKKMDKEPRGLGYYGITKDDVIDWLDWYISNESHIENENVKK